MQKKFSIITPVLNEVVNIKKSIESVINQKDSLYQYVIIDGGSTDGTVQILEDYKIKYPDEIKFISEPDKGLYDAMNKGLELAEGEYVYFLGAGDTLRKDILCKVKPELNNQTEIIYGNMFNETKGFIYNGKYDKLKLCFVPMPHQAMFYHKSVFDIVGNYNLKYVVNGDYEFNLRCLGNGINIKYLDLIIANFEGDGISSKIIDKEFKRDKGKIILEYFGEEYYRLFKLYPPFASVMSDFWVNWQFIDFLNNNKKVKVALFGAGAFGKGLLNFILAYNREFGIDIKVKFFTDNNRKIWGKKCCNIEIKKPEMGILRNIDYIIISSSWADEIKKQLMNMGISRDKLIIL